MGAEEALRMDPGPRRQEEIRSLDDVAAGEGGLVYHILFDLVRARCDELGIRPGLRLSCVGKTPEEVRLRLPDGSEIELERHFAHFVQMVRPTDESAGDRRSADRAEIPARSRVGVA